MSSANDLAKDIILAVQSGMADKASPAKLHRAVVAILQNLIRGISEDVIDEDFVVVVTMQAGEPGKVFTNHPGLMEARYVFVDDISVLEDEDSAIIIEEDTAVVKTGFIDVMVKESSELYIKAG